MYSINLFFFIFVSYFFILWRKINISTIYISNNRITVNTCMTTVKYQKASFFLLILTIGNFSLNYKKEAMLNIYFDSNNTYRIEIQSNLRLQFWTKFRKHFYSFSKRNLNMVPKWLTYQSKALIFYFDMMKNLRQII